MHGLAIAQVASNLGVTGKATVIHAGGSPWGRVTRGTVGSSMGRYAAQCYPAALRVQVAGGKEYAATQQGVTANEEHGQQRGDNTHRG